MEPQKRIRTERPASTAASISVHGLSGLERLQSISPYLLAILCALPFLDQAIHVDEPNFLALAHHARPNPLRLYDFHINWGGTPERAFDILANPPAIPWLLALLSPLAQLEPALPGGAPEVREWVYRLAFLPFLLLTLLGMRRLGERFARTPNASSLPPDSASGQNISPHLLMVWTLASPAVLLASHLVMPDVALLACLTLGLAITLDALDARIAPRALGGGLLLGTVSLCRYSGTVVVPLLILFLLLHAKTDRTGSTTAGFEAGEAPPHSGASRGVVSGLALVGTLLPSLVWAGFSQAEYGVVHFLAMTVFQAGDGGASLTSGALLHKALYQASSLSWAIGLPALLAWGVAGAPGKEARAGALAGALVGALFLADLLPLTTPPLPFSSHLMILLGWMGTGAVGGMMAPAFAPRTLRRTLRGRGGPHADTLFLSCWILGVLLFNERLRFASVRYLLPALPAVLLLVARALNTAHRHNGSRSSSLLRAQQWLSRTGVAGGCLAFSLWLAWGDMTFAETYRGYVQSLGIGAEGKGAPRTHFAGHWGFQFYLEQWGGVAVDENQLEKRGPNVPRPGEIVITSMHAWPQDVSELKQKVLDVQTFPAPAAPRTFTLEGGACFYSSLLAPGRSGPTPVFLPFGFGGDPLELISRVEVLP